METGLQDPGSRPDSVIVDPKVKTLYYRSKKQTAVVENSHAKTGLTYKDLHILMIHIELVVIHKSSQANKKV